MRVRAQWVCVSHRLGYTPIRSSSSFLLLCPSLLSSTPHSCRFSLVLTGCAVLTWVGSVLSRSDVHCTGVNTRPHLLATTLLKQRFILFDQLSEILAALHALDFQALGLEKHGRQGNFAARQVKTWSRQFRLGEATIKENVGKHSEVSVWNYWHTRPLFLYGCRCFAA